MRELAARIDALSQGSDAEGWVAACDALLIDVGHVALEPAPEAASLLPGLERLTPVLADRLRADAWQHRTHALNLAQLHAAVGKPLDAATWWLRVAQLTPDRAPEAMGHAGALFIRAGAYERWLETQTDRRPKTALKQQALARTVRLLEGRIVGPAIGTLFLVEDLRWEELSALVKEALAPAAAPFVAAFDDDAVFSGVLSLPPSTPEGFFVDGVVARDTPKAQALLTSAIDSRRAADQVRAVWDTPVSDALLLPPTPESAAQQKKDHATFVALVEQALGDALAAKPDAVRGFEGASHAAVATLAAALGDRFLDQRHNASPSPRELLKQSPATATFGGHVVYPPRTDFRVDVVSVTMPTAAVPPAWKKSADEVVARGTSTYLWWD